MFPHTLGILGFECPAAVPPVAAVAPAVPSAVRQAVGGAVRCAIPEKVGDD